MIGNLAVQSPALKNQFKTYSQRPQHCMGERSPFAICQPILQLCTATGFATKSAMVTRDTQYDGIDSFPEEVELIEVLPISSKI